jgi:hypothetical protein
MMVAGLIHSCTIQKRFQKQKLTYSAATGTASIGQTVTGGASLAIAVIDQLFAGYLVVKTVTGTFTAGENITIGKTLTSPGPPPVYTTTWTATLGTQTAYKNSQGVPEYYWKDNQTGIPCRFYSPGKSPVVLNMQTGTFVPKPLYAMFDASVTLTEVEYRIVTTSVGFVGTWNVDPVIPRSTMTGIDHYEATLKKEPNP